MMRGEGDFRSGDVKSWVRISSSSFVVIIQEDHYEFNLN